MFDSLMQVRHVHVDSDIQVELVDVDAGMCVLGRVAEAQEVGFVVEHDVELEAFSFDLKLAALEHREVGLDLAELVLVVEDLVAVVCAGITWYS